ncbi:hypothetical protein HO173_009146 [Letharia columbiana]|uniref:Uncharacterized protein n=1 Tax=Letharia columbiana TaxID=112416 RepID=A0A8H6FQ96_9LECA|nr:uncharacterized protein HO173_009146 [Letharia columbiana]KAF6232707.1 hypothetical protein HO173_009146 [Letharia columbiana]
MSTTHIVSLLQWRREQTRQRYIDLFTEHVDNTHSEPATKWHSTYSILSYLPTKPTNRRDGTEDGFLMARAWETQGKSTVKLPGQAANRCWRMTHACVGFSSVLPMDLMARAWETQGKSTVKLPGRAAVGVEAKSGGLWQETGRRRTRRILLVRRQMWLYLRDLWRLGGSPCGPASTNLEIFSGRASGLVFGDTGQRGRASRSQPGGLALRGG